MSRIRALTFFAALTVPIGIITHIASEAIGTGRNAFVVALSPVHAYLGIAAVFAFAVMAWAWRAMPSGDLRRRAALLAKALPGRGAGLRFGATSAAVQFAFVAITLWAEHAPLGGGIWLTAVAALLASAIGGALLGCLRSTIESFGDGSFTAPPRVRNRHARVAQIVPLAGPYFAFVPVRGNRPPPPLR